ncbi:hypothetical protein Mgra_00006952, partial [Meloidogyne graminicola]
TEDSSDFELEIEVKFERIINDSQISLFICDKAETASTSTPKSTGENNFYFEDFKNEVIEKINTLQLKFNLMECKNNSLEKEMKYNEKILNNKITDLNKELNNLTFEIKKLRDGKFVKFLYIANKWKFIDPERPCCENNCVNTDKPTGYCTNGNGFIEIISDTNIKCNKYINENGINKIAKIRAEYPFKLPNENIVNSCLNCPTFYLFYYEIKFFLPENQFEYNAGIGLRNNNNDYIFGLLPKGKLIYYRVQKSEKIINLSSFSFNKTNDIIGCGLVYPTPKITEKLPYIFFTQNGKQIYKAILLKQNYEYLQPYVDLKFCSVEANFGEDLNKKDFQYNIYKHYVLENDEEFYEI